MNKEKIKKNVHALKVWRVSQGLTQLQLARRIGYTSQSVIQGIEANRLEPKIGEVLLLCELSGGILSPEDFKDMSLEAENG